MVIRIEPLHIEKQRGPVLGAETYPKFRRALADSGCTLCPLSSGRTRIVVDRGNHNARALVIGEAPGAEEDRQGKAFVGRAGRLLDRLMEDAGLDAERDFLIANLVKCRPPKNRVPRVEEVRACFPFLRRQVELVRPRVLALLGATAVKYLLEAKPPKRRLTDRVGRFYEHPGLPGIEIFLLFHPSYILRNPRKRPLMVRHLKVLRDRMRAIAREEIPLN